MLIDYQKKQPIAYKILQNDIDNNHIKHAYLFEIGDNNIDYNIVMEFVKEILCVDSTQNPQIDKNIFSELEIIEPDGMWIKKEQLVELQKDFSKKAIETKRKVYIIKQADRLNEYSANSILKFLEEPEDGIVAILITNNIYKIMSTILSRCQIVKIKNGNLENELDLIKSITKIPSSYDNIDIVNDKINQIKKFIQYLEKNKLETLVVTNQLFHNNFKEKEEILFALDLMILYYKTSLDNKIGQADQIEMDSLEIEGSIFDISKKIEIINKIKEKIKYNANKNLLIDKLIIEMMR